VWHLEPSLTTPTPSTPASRTRRCSVRRTAARSGTSCRAARPRIRDRNGSPARAACACTRSCSTRKIPTGSTSPSRRPARSARTTAARPGGRSTRGLHSQYIPEPTAEVGHCVHRIAMHPSRPQTLFMQKHWDIMRSDDGGDTWTRSAATCRPTSAFPSTCTHTSRDDLRRADQERRGALPAGGQAACLPQPQRGQRMGGADEGTAATGLLRQRPARRDGVDTLDPCGIYFGTTGGQVYASANSGDNWAPIVRDLPGVLSVEVQTLRDPRRSTASPADAGQSRRRGEP
jgi:hypothetical protein